MRSIGLVLGDTAYDVGYAVGTLVAALLLGYAVTWTWGLVRNRTGERLSSAWQWANHWRSLAAAGFLWLLSTVGNSFG